MTPPLRNLLVGTEQVMVVACRGSPNDNLRCQFGYDVPISVEGYDPEPRGLVQAPLNTISHRVIESIRTVNQDDFQPFMWAEARPASSYWRRNRDSIKRSSLSWMLEREGGRFFVANLVHNTTTGQLREHAIRLNSTVSCAGIAKTAFPSPCPGTQPFEASYAGQNVTISVCVPGNYTASPWGLSRDRQDISEELFVDVDVAAGPKLGLPFTVHCQSATSRGYFEIGNAQTDNAYGPLLAKWPDPAAMARDFDDELRPGLGVPPTAM